MAILDSKQVISSIGASVTRQVSSNISNAVTGAVTNVTSKAIGSVATKMLGGTIGGIVSNTLGTAVSNAIGGVVNNAVSGVVSNAVGSLLGVDAGKLAGTKEGMLVGSNPSYIKYENSAYQPAQDALAKAESQLSTQLSSISVTSTDTTIAGGIATNTSGLSVNTSDSILSASSNYDSLANTSSLLDEKTSALMKQRDNAKEAADKQSQYLCIYFDIIKAVTVSVESEVPQHPVEDGYCISDNISNKPATLSIEGGIAESPITWVNKNGKGKTKIQKYRNNLKKFRDAKTVLTFVRNNGSTYKNYALTNYECKKSDAKNIVWITMQFREIVKVKTATTGLDPSTVDKAKQDAAGGSGADGTASQASQTGTSQTPSDGAKSSSALYGAGQWISNTQMWKDIKGDVSEGYTAGVSSLGERQDED